MFINILIQKKNLKLKSDGIGRLTICAFFGETISVIIGYHVENFDEMEGVLIMLAVLIYYKMQKLTPASFPSSPKIALKIKLLI